MSSITIQPNRTMKVMLIVSRSHSFHSILQVSIDYYSRHITFIECQFMYSNMINQTCTIHSNFNFDTFIDCVGCFSLTLELSCGFLKKRCTESMVGSRCRMITFKEGEEFVCGLTESIKKYDQLVSISRYLTTRLEDGAQTSIRLQHRLRKWWQC